MIPDLVETTAHPGARPDHAVWQGRVFSVSGRSEKYDNFYSATGYGEGWGLCGWNCRHSFFPFIEELSDRAYPADKLREYNNKEVEYNGQKMSLYEATQQQRYIERQIRMWKREASAMDAAGLDSGYAYQKIRQWQAAQRDFIGQTGLRRDYFRERGGIQLGGKTAVTLDSPSLTGWINRTFYHPTTQADIDRVIANELNGIRFLAKPTHAPNLRPQGRTFVEPDPVTGKPVVTKILIGAQNHPGDKPLIRTLLHEQLEGKCGLRLSAEKLQRLLESPKEFMYYTRYTHEYIERVLDRFYKIKGW